MDRVPLAAAEAGFLLAPADLLFARQSLVLAGAGQCSLFLGNTEPTTFESHLIRCRLDRKRADPIFYFYFFRSQDGRRTIEAIVEQGAGASGIRGSDLVNLQVPCPPLSVQNEVAATLGALDDRIALLRETNATLEAIAQALFKSWFVDFDPVRAKSQGLAPAGMDEATATLFPSGFDETRRGPVPRGWREASIYEVAQVVYGAPFASSRFNTDGIGRPLVRIRDLRDEAPGVHTDEVHPKGYLLTPGDIVVGMDGEFRAYLWGGEHAWLNQRVCVFRPKAGVPAAFVRVTIEPQLGHIEATETATTVIHLGKGDIDRFVALVPPGDVLAAFGAIADPLYAQIVANKQTCRSLAALRDTLLPRLISGQLRLLEAEAALEAA